MVTDANMLVSESATISRTNEIATRRHRRACAAGIRETESQKVPRNSRVPSRCVRSVRAIEDEVGENDKSKTAMSGCNTKKFFVGARRRQSGDVGRRGPRLYFSQFGKVEEKDLLVSCLCSWNSRPSGPQWLRLRHLQERGCR